MSKLVDMKITKAERDKEQKKHSNPCGPSLGGDEYGYELRLRLGSRELEKLGFDKLPATGRKVRVSAEGVVISTNESASSSKGGDHKNRSLEIQLQKIAVNLEASSAVEAIDDALEE